MKILKRIVAIFLVVMLCGQSFAAVVSDNDGSAFITKAEFDSLKNNFQAQIDNYNSSIDSKIDGAIAAYLAGIRSSFNEDVELPYRNWKKVTAMNYLPEQTYHPFSFSCSTLLLQNCTLNTGAHAECIYVYMLGGYSRPTSKAARVLICDAGIETTDAPTTVTWLGRTYDYRDNAVMTMVLGDYYYNMVNDVNITKGKYITSLSSNQFYVCYWAYFYPYNGMNIANNCYSIWQPSIYDYNSADSSRRTYMVVSDKVVQSVSPNVTLGVGADGNTVDYAHVIHHEIINNIFLADPDWLNHFNYTDYSKTSYQFYNNYTSNPFTTRKYAGVESSGGWLNLQDTGGCYAGAYGSNTGSNKVPNFGVLQSTYSSDKIYQCSEGVQEIDDEEIVLPAPKLNNGFICFAAKANEKLKWSPKFIDRTSNTELNVSLATAPFTNGQNIESGGQYIKNNDQTENYLTTENGRCTFDFIMPEDGIVYCKWWPSTSISNWEATLDLTQCGYYTKTKQE